MRSCAIALILATSAFAQQAVPSQKSVGFAVAKVTVEVFSDYQCPYCRELYFRTVKPLIAEYAQKGKIYFIHREFPLPIHAYSKEAACFACAADRIGKYEQVCDAMFRDQDSWSKSGKVADTACAAVTPAEAKKLRELAHDPATVAMLEKDMELGRRAGINGTPSIFMTSAGKNYPVPYDATYSLLTRFVDQLISAR